MKNVGVIGTGYVGLTHGTILAEKGNRVICYDIDKQKVEDLKKGGMPIYEPGLEELVRKNYGKRKLKFTADPLYCISNSDVLFICVNTPPKQETGRFRKADLSYVENAARMIAQTMKGYKVIVDKSTVPVLTGEKVCETMIKSGTLYEFDVVSNPEFLREGKAVEDSLNPNRIVIGVLKDEKKRLLKRPLKEMRELYHNFNTQILETDIWSAELIKLASNAYLAEGVSFINLIAGLCAATGGDVTQVAEGMRLDKRIGKYAFLNAGLGFGGSCFQKDIENLYNIFLEKNIDAELFKQIVEVNKAQRMYFVKIIEEGLWTLKNKKIAALGLSFKPDTDDMREAPSVDIINKLVEEGANINVYDPKAMKNAKQHFKDKVTYCKNLEETVKGSDAIVLMTEWDEFKKMNLKKIKRMMNEPAHFFDGRNVFEPEKMSKEGFYYYSIGRPHIKPKNNKNEKH
ncbi:MAG: UDP-glucose/GDP-mannose dehydrogenase family protein [archaeon]